MACPVCGSAMDTSRRPYVCGQCGTVMGVTVPSVLPIPVVPILVR